MKPTTEGASPQTPKVKRTKARPPVLKRSPKTNLVTIRHLTGEIKELLKEEWRLLGGLGLVFAVAYRVLVEGLSHVDLGTLQQATQNNDAGSGFAQQTINGVLLTGSALNSSSTSNGTLSGFYATLLTVIFALCIVWALRQVLAGRQVRVRDALYNGAAPLITVVAVLGVILAQTLPLVIGLFIYVAATTNHVTQGVLQNSVVLVVAGLGALLTCYWLGVSLIAVMTATVPGMYPFAALRSAKELVGDRRWQIFLRVIIFAMLVAIVWLLVIVISVSNPVTKIFTMEILDILRALTVVVTTVYLYKLYRSLVDETAE